MAQLKNLIVTGGSRLIGPTMAGQLTVKNSIKGQSSLAHNSTTASGVSGYHLITIKDETSWMYAFTVRIYQSYRYYDIAISGYNYGSNYWHDPNAVMIASDDKESVEVHFGYTGAYKLWVAIPAANYYGIDIFNVVNGYTQIDDWADAFEITHVTTLPGTKQSTVTASRPWYSNETVSKASSADTALKDGAGNIITDKYVTLDTAQTLTGVKTFTKPVQLSRVSGAGSGSVSFYSPSYYTWYEYMSNVDNGSCPTGGKPSTLGDVTIWARRSLIENVSGYGWVWESASNAAASSSSTTPTPVMSLSSSTGRLRLTGPLDYSNSSGGALTSNYISAGGGYSVNSGRLGLKLVAIDQNDIQAGIGIDLTGLSYETCLSTGRKEDGTASYITFATHTNETKAYKRLGYFAASGKADPDVTFNVNGSITATGNISLATTANSWIGGKTPSNAAINITTTQTSGSYHPALAIKGYSGHVWNIGGLKDEVGIYGYYSTRTENGTDYKTVWDTATGTITHTGALTVSGTITGTLAGNASSATKATQDGSGNTITTYYCTLSTAQTVSGAKTFSGNNTHSGTNSFTGKNVFTASNSYNTTDTQKFVVGNSTSAFVFGGDGLQCFSGTSSTTAKAMYAQYYGGGLQIGGSAQSNLSIKGNITPLSSDTYVLGGSSAKWLTGYITTVEATKTIYSSKVTVQYNSTDACLEFNFA